MQGKKKICAIFATVILFLSVFIYVTRFDVREGLCAEAGTDIEYILNENNLHDYINVSRVFDKYLTIDSTGVNTRRSGEYTIKVINRITGDVLKVPLSIVDTKDPQVEWNDYIPQILVGCSITADIFVKNAVDDAGIGKIYFYSEEGGRQSSFTPQSEGTYSVSVVVQDINNRKVSKGYLSARFNKANRVRINVNFNSCEAYVVKFKAKLKEFEYYTFYDSKTEYEEDKQANLIMLRKQLVSRALESMMGNSTSEIYAYMKPNTVIIPENIIKYVSAKEWRKKCT